MSKVPGSGRASSRRRLLLVLAGLAVALVLYVAAAAFLLLRDPGGGPHGVAIYADWTTSPEEWREFEQARGVTARD